MGRIILTNNQTWSNKLENNFSNLLGLTKTGDIENTIRLKVYQKKKVKNENFYKTTDGIIATNGTIFYKELINEEALKEILKDFKELLKKYDIDISECITKLRKNMIGSFSIFIKLENLAILFVDETAMYPLYYYHNKDYYLITNTYYNINECTNTECDILPLLEKGICSTIVGNKTPFKNIKRLQEDEYILLENNNLKVKNVKVNKYEYKYENYYEAFEILKKEIEKIGRIRAKKIKRTLLFTTGGLDSRMELALHNFFEDDLVLGYWSGKDLITNGTKDDLEICRELAQKTKKDFNFFDVSFSFEECLSSLTEEELSKFGEYACIYAHNKKWLDLFDKIEGFDSVGFGSLNEIIRETPQIDEIEENQVTIKDLITKVKMRSRILKKVINYDELSNYILIQMKKKFNLTGETVSKDIGVNLFNENRLSANTIVDSYSNLYYYDFNICGQKNIVDLIESMPYKWRQQSKLILALTKEWNENLLEVPYFSHHTKVIYNKKLGTIELSQFNKIKRKIKKILENSIFYNLTFKTYQKLKGKEKNNSEKNNIFSICNKELTKSEILKENNVEILYSPKVIDFDLATLATMVAEIKMVELLKQRVRK